MNNAIAMNMTKFATTHGCDVLQKLLDAKTREQKATISYRNAVVAVTDAVAGSEDVQLKLVDIMSKARDEYDAAVAASVSAEAEVAAIIAATDDE